VNRLKLVFLLSLFMLLVMPIFGVTTGELKIIKTVIKEGDVVFDVGANVGNWSKNVLAVCPKVKIYAFEPIPSIYSLLMKKFNNYKFFAYNIAFSSCAGNKEFYFYPKDSAKSGFYDREILRNVCSLVPRKIVVKVDTLSTFCERNNIIKIDFLKIDTEGEELHVLLGAKDLLEKNNISIIQFEYGGCYKDSGTTLREVYDLLSSFGYSLFKRTKKGLIKVEKWRDELEDFGYSNYLAMVE